MDKVTVIGLGVVFFVIAIASFGICIEITTMSKVLDHCKELGYEGAKGDMMNDYQCYKTTKEGFIEYSPELNIEVIR